MADKEKVIKGLECCAAMSGDECSKCPYGDECVDTDLLYGIPHLASDALSLLKEQEAKTGHWVLNDEDTNAWECSECGSLQIIIDGTPLDNSWFFCPHCGAKLEGR